MRRPRNWRTQRRARRAPRASDDQRSAASAEWATGNGHHSIASAAAPRRISGRGTSRHLDSGRRRARQRRSRRGRALAKRLGCGDGARRSPSTSDRRDRDASGAPAMSGAELALAVAVFLACAVEAVEATTIVLAMGTTRSWSSALVGVGAAALVLAVLVAALGPALTALPHRRPAARRGRAAAGLRAAVAAQGDPARRRPEGAPRRARRVRRRTARAARERPARSRARFDGYSFAISFKGVLLEGLEVVFIVLTFGANQHASGWPRSAAAAAVRAGRDRRRRRARAARARAGEHDEVRRRRDADVVRNLLGRGGRGRSWPGGDAALLVIVPGAARALPRVRRAAAGGRRRAPGRRSRRDRRGARRGGAA